MSGAVLQKFQCVEVSTKEPRTVLLMLDSPEAVVVCKACEAIHKYIDKCEQYQCIKQSQPYAFSY